MSQQFNDKDKKNVNAPLGGRQDQGSRPMGGTTGGSATQKMPAGGANRDQNKGKIDNKDKR